MLCIIQARYSSKRLPGKVLKKINGKPMILYLFESLKKVNETIDQDDIKVITKLIRSAVANIFRDIWLKRNTWK